MDRDSIERPDAGPPPVGRSWGRLYATVLLLLAIEVALFWLFSRWVA